MIETILVSLVFILVVCGGLALGQFFGREPVTPKCNPGPCCLEGDNCERRASCKSKES